MRNAGAPDWARDILAAERERYGLPEITVNWRIGHDGNPQTSGTATSDKFHIGITAGTGEADQRVMLLHELAHLIVPGHAHDDVWRAVADELWARYGVTEEAALHEQVVKLMKDPEVRRKLGLA